MKKGIAVKTITILAIFVLTIVIILSWLIPHLWGTMIEDVLPIKKKGELARFIRYVKCSIAACTGGCNSAETQTVGIDYEGGEVVLSCNQLLSEDEYGYSYCNEYNDGKKLCGDKYPINFIFKEETVYRGDYDLKKKDPSTYRDTNCNMILDEGWQTDLSCIGRPSNLYPCPCERCLKDRRLHGEDPIPYGVLFDSGGSCSTSGKDRFVGSLWLPHSFADPTNGNCVDGGEDGSLKSCTFPENTQVQIWTDGKTQGGVCGWWGAQCIHPPNNCPRVVICPT